MSRDNFMLNHSERPSFVKTELTGTSITTLGHHPRLEFIFKPQGREEWFASRVIALDSGPFEVARALEELAVLIRDVHMQRGRFK